MVKGQRLCSLVKMDIMIIGLEGVGSCLQDKAVSVRFYLFYQIKSLCYVLRWLKLLPPVVDMISDAKRQARYCACSNCLFFCISPYTCINQFHENDYHFMTGILLQKPSPILCFDSQTLELFTDQ
jgi:hypothetical protein